MLLPVLECTRESADGHRRPLVAHAIDETGIWHRTASGSLSSASRRRTPRGDERNHSYRTTPTRVMNHTASDTSVAARMPRIASRSSCVSLGCLSVDCRVRGGPAYCSWPLQKPAAELSVSDSGTNMTGSLHAWCDGVEAMPCVRCGCRWLRCVGRCPDSAH